MGARGRREGEGGGIGGDGPREVPFADLGVALGAQGSGLEEGRVHLEAEHDGDDLGQVDGGADVARTNGRLGGRWGEIGAVDVVERVFRAVHIIIQAGP